MSTINIFSKIFITTIFTFGCGVTDTPIEPEPESENIVQAMINGELWETNDSYASFNIIEGDTLIYMGSTLNDSTNFYYHERIVFAYYYSGNDTSYSTVRKNAKHEQREGVLYGEFDVDVIRASYNPISDSLDQLTLSVTKDSLGRRFIEGEFEMTVVVDPAYDRDIDQDRRRRPDTVRITNGYYRVELEKRNN